MRHTKRSEGSDDDMEISIRISWQEEFMNGGLKEKKSFDLA